MRLTLVTMMVSLLLAVPAVAKSPLTDAYGGSGVLASEVQPRGPQAPSRGAQAPSLGAQAPSRAAIGSLPFTGMEVLLILGAGLTLLVVGFGIRRLAAD